MRSAGRKPIIVLLPLGALPALVACSAMLAYPDSTPENTADLCADGTDNDFDGQIDCDDPDCDGTCQELASTRCGDGRDNDGDGLVDAADPGCWVIEAPKPTRCASAEPTSFVEHFDAALRESRWLPFAPASDTSLMPSIEPPRARSAYPNHVLGFPASAERDASPSGLVSLATFDGDWSAFSIAFQARVPQGGWLRVALVPALLAPAGSAPVQGAELSSVGVDVDARAEPVVALLAGGSSSNASLADGSGWHDFVVTNLRDTLELRVDGSLALSTPSPSVGPSRLAVWEGVNPTSSTASSVQLDDLALQLAGSRPCGVQAPQIPSRACPLDPEAITSNTGYSVSAAHDPRGRLCAAVTSGDLNQQAAFHGSSWTSGDGDAWDFGGAFPAIGRSDPWMGVAVARDEDAGEWRAALVSGSATESSLYLSSSESCRAWKPWSEGIPIPSGIGAPSYLLPGKLSRHELYFGKRNPATDALELWRMRSDDGASFSLDDSAIAVFPADEPISEPLSLSRFGRDDIVLTHRMSPSAGALGLGVWVAADVSLTTWEKASPWIWLQPNAVAGGADAQSMASGTLVSDARDGFLLYGALGNPIPRLSDPSSTVAITTGTARLHGSSESLSDAMPAALPGDCGDGDCGAGESCETCPVDCGPCDGTLIFAERFDTPSDWQLNGGASAEASASLYVSPTLHQAVIAPGSATWLRRSLPSALRGNFELSFDVHGAANASLDGRCSAFVGLSRQQSLLHRTPSGVFAQLEPRLACDPLRPQFGVAGRSSGKFTSTVRVSQDPGTSGLVCGGVVPGNHEAWHHVVLQRKDGLITGTVSGRDTCTSALGPPVLVKYSGTLDDLDTLFIGFGPTNWTKPCTIADASLSVDNLVVRQLPCSEATTTCTDPSTAKQTCVNLETSPEHCGGCFQALTSAELCVGGEPSCLGVDCSEFPNGSPCVDMSSDAEHCGGCGNAVGPLAVCTDSNPVAITVALPDGYDMDATEVTRRQYATWLDTKPDTGEQPSECAWNTTFEPTCMIQLEDHGDRAVACVDWCDARAYCAAVGKSLCGKIGGGAMSQSEAATQESEWYMACSSGGIHTYPYGADYEPTTCNGGDNRLPDDVSGCARPRDAAEMSGCQSPVPDYAGVFDLSGGVAEWIDACDGNEGENDGCATMGGSACTLSGPLRCGVVTSATRSSTSSNLGFRCCAR